MLNLARNELYRLFLSPLAWVILALSQALLAYLFLSHLDYFMQIQSQIAAIPGAPGVTEMIVAPLLGNAAIVLLLISPLITMRLLAEERRNESLPLLTSAPLTAAGVVMGKFLGSFAFLLILLFMVLLMPLSLLLGSHIDLMQLASGALGLLLLIASFMAIGLFLSSLTRQPAIAAVATFSLLFFLWIVDWAGQSGHDDAGWLGWLSLLKHFEPMLQGELYTADVAYYLIVTLTFLLLAIRKLDNERLTG